MGKIDAAQREARLRSIGIKGKLPDALTEGVVDAARANRTGETFSLADGRVPGLALDVGAEGSATFWLAYRTHAGERRRMKIAVAGAVTLKTARELAMDALAAVGRGEDPSQTRKEARAASLTVRSYLEDTYAPKTLAHAKTGKDSKARILSRAWAPLLDRPVAQLTRDVIEKVLSDRKEAGRAAGTMLRDWSAFRAMLADAVDRGVLAAIPMARRPEPIRKMKGNERVRYLGQRDEEGQPGGGERERCAAALAAFTSDEPGGGDFLRFAAGLALATGMRRGEIVRLTEKMINRRERRIDLPAEVTKSNKARRVALSDEALAALALWKVRGTAGELCPGDAERWEDRISQREWPRLREQAALVDFHFHDLRHDFAVRLLRACGSLHKVRDAMGHAAVAQTERYAHVAEREVSDAVLLLGKAL